MFSVIIPTRNRPTLLKRALNSVRSQRNADFELIVVDDGTATGFDASMRLSELELKGVGRFLHLRPRQRGHGPSHALNVGAAAACGRFLCFLDDDDEWTDVEHLERAAAVVCSDHTFVMHDAAPVSETDFVV